MRMPTSRAHGHGSSTLAPSVVKDELTANAANREELETQLAATGEPSPLLHPEWPGSTARRSQNWRKALQQPRSEATEATEALRGVVDAIMLTPDQAGDTLQIELRGNLAATSPCKCIWLLGLATR